MFPHLFHLPFVGQYYVVYCILKAKLSFEEGGVLVLHFGFSYYLYY